MANIDCPLITGLGRQYSLGLLVRAFANRGREPLRVDRPGDASPKRSAVGKVPKGPNAFRDPSPKASFALGEGVAGEVRQAPITRAPGLGGVASPKRSAVGKVPKGPNAFRDPS